MGNLTPYGGAVLVAVFGLAGCGGGNSASSPAKPVPLLSTPVLTAPTAEPANESSTPPTEVSGTSVSLNSLPPQSSPHQLQPTQPTTMPGDPGSSPISVNRDYLSGVTPESVPMAISEHLNEVQLAVRTIVGNDVFTGAAFDEADPANGHLIIYGIQAEVLMVALDQVGTDQRSRITVVESPYSFSDLQDFITQADTLLRDDGLEPLWIAARHDGTGIEATLKRSQVLPDNELIAAANEALRGLPTFITVSDPPIPL
jgi:hypothetical protein